MIGKFRDCSEHIMNVMHMSGITCEQELVKHLDQITLENEWGTHVELTILGALAKIDVLVINATHVDQNQWRIDDIYIHNRLLNPTQSSPVYKGQKLGVVLHRLHNKVELYISIHFTTISLIMSNFPNLFSVIAQNKRSETNVKPWEFSKF